MDMDLDLDLNLNFNINLNLNLNINPQKLRDRRVPASLAQSCPGHQVSASCTHTSCPAQPNQVVPRVSPPGGP